jgi:hypothetical protein
MPPINPTPVGTDQVYVVPAGTIPFVILVGVTLKVTPLQVVVVIALMVAVGLTVIVNVNTAPVQLPDKGVIV